MSDNILTVSNVSRQFTDSEKTITVLSDIDFELKQGECVSIIGTSGCGKTTLLRLVAGFDKATGGEIRFRDKAVDGLDYRRGYIFQQHNLFPWLTVEKNIEVGLKARHVKKTERPSVQEYVELVGLHGFEKSFPHQISGGMAQRTAIARALINEPQLLLLDEPMGALDTFTRADIQDKLLEIRKLKDLTMLIVTHDLDEALYMSDRIIIMSARPGKISEVINVNIPYPRNRSGTEFLALRNVLLEKFDLANAQPQPEYII